MAGKVEIINQALFRVGSDPILTIDENTKQARVAKTLYDMQRDALLEEYPWMFAKKRATLSQLSTTPDFGFNYYYQLPADCLHVLELYGSTSNFEIESEGKLAVDDEDVQIKYVAKVTLEGAWPPSFVQALAATLAYHMTEALGKDKALKATLLDEKNMAIAEAKRLGAIQDNVDEGQNDDSTWQSAGR
jgi:hypothetical protein